MSALRREDVASGFGGVIDKTSRYGWKTVDGPGEMGWLNKSELKVHPSYQRERQMLLVKTITADWSWLACGVLIVGLRGGEFWIIDGQQRWCAALRRSDIQNLPCIVFDTEDVQQEANGFLGVNTGRRIVSALDKHRARLAALNEDALFVQQTLDGFGIELTKTANRAGQTESIDWLTKKAMLHRDSFELIVSFADGLSRKDEIPLRRTLLDGLWHLHRNLLADGLADARVQKRLEAVGAVRLEAAARRASAYYSAGGASVWAKGMLDELNKGLRTKLRLKVDEDEGGAS